MLPKKLLFFFEKYSQSRKEAKEETIGLPTYYYSKFSAKLSSTKYRVAKHDLLPE